MQARRSTLRQAAEQFAHVPALHEMQASATWGWRFAGALFELLFREESGCLSVLHREASTGWQRVAAAVCLCASMLEQSDRRTAALAVDLLTVELTYDDVHPVDTAWLQLQRARARAELGHREDSRRDALAVQRTRVVAPDDLTATALAGTAGAIIFDSDWRTADLGATIRGGDTVASWWRSQTVLRGLTAAHDREFASWSDSSSAEYADGDPTQRHLLVAAASASFLGSHGNWRNLAGRAAQDMLMRDARTSDVETVAGYVEELQRAGHDKALAQGVKRLVEDGPCAAVVAAATRRALSETTSGSIAADLVMVEAAGDLLPLEAASERVG